MSDPFYPFSGGGFFGAGGDAGPSRGYTDYEVDLIAARYAGAPLPSLFSAGAPLPSLSSADVPLPILSSAEVGYFDAHLGARRSAEVLYHHSLMGSHSTVGQSEPLYSSNTMVKRPRLESNLTIYPRRPGEKACAFYMRSRTCKYGEDCRFDHPHWVPGGGIPNWREKPKSADSTALPVRPSERVCSYYEKTGKCKFGASCRFDHPKENEMPTLIGRQTIYTATIDAEVCNVSTDGSTPEKKHTPAGPAEAHNTKGLPIRPGEVDCSFYMKTGSCMYGSTCRYNHPDRPADAALTAPGAQGILSTPAPNAPAAVLNPVATLLPGFDIHATLMAGEPEPVTYPQRPGETVCDFYMKTGTCKYTDKCKFHHPIDRSVPRPNESWDPQQTVILTPAGLPRREDAEVCAFYMKSGTCKFGVQCRFDHPPPEEAISRLKAAGGKKGAKKAAKLMAAARKQDEKKSEGLSIVLDKP